MMIPIALRIILGILAASQADSIQDPFYAGMLVGIGWAFLVEAATDLLFSITGSTGNRRIGGSN